MKTALMVPVKELNQAKSRLADVMTSQQREALAMVLLQGVLEAVARVPDVRKVVVTSYGPAIDMANSHGFEVLRESRQVSESASVDQASGKLEQEGIAAVLRVPLDLPLLSTDDLETILAHGSSGLQSVLVPSRDGSGTNGLYRSPPTLFPSQFGPDSRKLHEQSLQTLGASYEVLPLTSMALDIDDARDVVELTRLGVDCPALRYLEQVGALARVGSFEA